MKFLLFIGLLKNLNKKINVFLFDKFKLKY